MPKMMKYSIIIIVVIASNSLAIAQTSIDSDAFRNSWCISSEWWNYTSYSQQKNEMPMKAGYPAIKSQSMGIGIAYNIYTSGKHHEIKLSLTLPAGLDSDNGTGENYLLTESNSDYFRSGLDYRFSLPLYSWNDLRCRHAFISGLLYEDRTIEYLSGSSEHTSDINLYIGPGLKMKYDIAKSWGVETVFDARFYLPYLNYGKLNTHDDNGNNQFSASYIAFYYQTIFKLGVVYNLLDYGIIRVGIRKNDLIGFANREPKFHVDNLIHHKFDRLYHFYVAYEF